MKLAAEPPELLTNISGRMRGSLESRLARASICLCSTCKAAACNIHRAYNEHETSPLICIWTSRGHKLPHVAQVSCPSNCGACMDRPTLPYICPLVAVLFV